MAKPVPAAPTAPSSTAPSADPDDPRAQAGKLIGGGVAAVALGYGARSYAKGARSELEALRTKAAGERNTEARAAITKEQGLVEVRGDVAFTAGMAGFAFGAALVVAGLAAGGGVRLRKALFALAPAMLFVSIYATYVVGPESLLVSSAAAFALIVYLTGEPNARRRAEADAFRRLPMRLATGLGAIDEAGRYRHRANVAKTQPTALLRSVGELPPALGRLVVDVGEGRPYRYDRLRDGLAYVAFVEADASGASDYVTVVMALASRAPRFVARPLPIVEGQRVANSGVTIKGDPEFTKAFLVEARATDADKARAFLTEEVRDELLELPEAWLHVEGEAMALTLFGPFDLERADRLVEVADVLFAEHGAGGGESLLEPDGVVRPGTGKAKKREAPERGVAEGAGA